MRPQRCGFSARALRVRYAYVYDRFVQQRTHRWQSFYCFCNEDKTRTRLIVLTEDAPMSDSLFLKTTSPRLVASRVAVDLWLGRLLSRGHWLKLAVAALHKRSPHLGEHWLHSRRVQEQLRALD